MDASDFHARILLPGLVELQSIAGIPVTGAAAHFLLAIATQESALIHRYQIYKGPGKPGPARGWWQFERNGGVAGVLSHRKTKGMALKLCAHCAVEAYSHTVWRALEGHDLLAVGFARLLIWTSRKALPIRKNDAWTQYARDLWRPGKPHPEVWGDNWEQAKKIVIIDNKGEV